MEDLQPCSVSLVGALLGWKISNTPHILIYAINVDYTHVNHIIHYTNISMYHILLLLLAVHVGYIPTDSFKDLVTVAQENFNKHMICFGRGSAAAPFRLVSHFKGARIPQTKYQNLTWVHRSAYNTAFTLNW